jgi:hypothetical protein
MTVRLTVRSTNHKKAKNWQFDPKMRILIFSPHFYLFKEMIGVKMKGEKGNSNKNFVS